MWNGPKRTKRRPTGSTVKPQPIWRRPPHGTTPCWSTFRPTTYSTARAARPIAKKTQRHRRTPTAARNGRVKKPSRTAWLYSETGKNFLRTMLRLTAERETLDVVCDQVGTPTYAGDLALAIFSIVENGLHTGNEGIYHFTDEGVCSWYDFAVEIAAAAGNDRCRIRPCRTEDYPAKAARPAWSVLDKSKIRKRFGIEIPHWRESMLYCLQRMKTNAKEA